MSRPARCIHWLAGNSKKNTQQLADIIGTYGSGVIQRRLSYEEQVGLGLNLDRTITRQGLGTLTALTCSLSGEVPLFVFEAMTDDSAEAKAMYEAHQAQKAINEQARLHTEGAPNG